jgi:hypothetical protein
MVVGGTSWIAMMGWVIAIFILNTPGESPRVVMLDPIGMVGLMIAVYVSTIVLSGIGFLWSVALTRKYPNLCSSVVTALRAMIGVVMGLPLLWLALISVFNIS